MKRLALFTAIILGIVIGALALWQMREALEILLVSLAISAGMAPLVDRLIQRGWKRAAAVGLTFALALLLLIAFVALFGALGYADIATIAAGLPSWYDALRRSLLGGGAWLARLAALLPSTDALVASLAAERFANLGAFVLNVVTGTLALGATAIGAASLVFYWLLDQQRIERLWLSLLPLNTRTIMRAVWRQIYAEVGLYVRGEALLVSLTALILLAIYAALGLPAAALLAIIGGLAQVVPLLGLPIALLPAVAVALAQDATTGLLTLVLALAALTAIRLLVARRVFASGIDVNPVLVVFLILALAEIGSVWMILLAPPLAAAIQATVRVLSDEARAQTNQAQNPALDALRERLNQVEGLLEPDATVTPQLTALLARARTLLADAADDARVRDAAQPQVTLENVTGR